MKMVRRPWWQQLSSALQTLLGDIVKPVIVYIFSLLCYGFLVFSINMFWLEYSETMVGRRVLAMQREIPRLIAFISNVDILLFSLYVNTTALIVSICIAGVSKFLHIKYFFYDYSGFLFRVGFWGALHTLGTAYVLRKHFDLQFIDLLKIACIPCLFFLTVSFDFVSRTIPTIGALAVRVIARVPKSASPSR